jgi:hypothetical protein
MPFFSPQFVARLARSASGLACAVGMLAISTTTVGAEEATSYERDVRPILKRRCFACHGALKQEAELRVDTVATMLSGGDSGAVIQPGDPGASLLIERISSPDELERMPPEGEPLSVDEIANIRQWIKQGAEVPANEKAENDPRRHWAFRPPQRADVPNLKTTWIRNPIDAFVAAEQKQRDLIPVREVEASLLLRRVYLDLIGLPPTRQQQQRFLADNRASAYNDVVEELLLSPHHGERWGRHWMDIWRYSDWYGLGAQLRNSQKHIWHWRDWIVESLNKDKGYDQMVMEMLAADEIAPTDQDALRATGFLARNYYLFNRTTWLDSTVEHTSKSLLGLTLNCAKCHDHKYDPLLQEDYYRMRAVFEPHQVRLDPVPGETDLEKDGLPRVFDAHLDEPTYVHIRGDAKNLDKSRKISPGGPSFLAINALSPTRIALPLLAHRPELQPFVLVDHLRNAEATIEAKTNAVKKADRALASARALAASQAAEKEMAETDPLAKPFLHDDFDEPNAAIWETGPGTWKYEGGRLVQTETGASRRYLRSRANHPPDFTARFKFKTTGGDRWRSVGLSFDVVDGREKMVYLSAVDGGSKVQVSYKAGPNQQYPPTGKQDRPVLLNQLYDVQISVRGTLINVAIDGQHALAYELPVPRETGKLDLVAFDAVAEFYLLDVRQLSTEAVLVAASKPSSPVTTVAQAEAAAQTARLELATAQARPETIRTAQAADLAKWKVPAAENLDSLIHTAAVAARQYEAAVAEANVAAKSAKLASSAADARSKNEKELEQARLQLETAKAAITNPGETYTSLRVSRKAAEGPDEKEQSRNEAFPTTSTGRRTALARWIVNRDNPLTARVAVNHIWARHFGQPLVETVFDFGLRSPAPPQQALLDWLAVELMENNWSHRHIHRLIVTSQTYRLSTISAAAGSRTETIDPHNHFFWHRKPLRMESQVIRDSLLHLAGALNLKLGGPSIAATADGKEFRRSLYFKHSRDDTHPFLSMFDDADILACYRRSESIVPQQALALANSKLPLQMARKISETIGPISDDAFVTAAFETLLCRLPTEQERTLCLQTLDELTDVAKEQNLKPANQRARANLTHALMNHNDFITIR